MKIYNLPNDFSNAEEQKQDIIIRAYQSKNSSLKNKSIIHQNMIDIIISGQKSFTDVHNTKTLDAGELMILSKGNCLISQALPQEGLFSSLVFYFTNEIFSDFLIKYDPLFRNKNSGSDKKTFLIYRQDNFIQAYINSIKIMLQYPLHNSAELRQLKLEELLLHLLYVDAAKLQSLSIVAGTEDDMQVRMAAQSNIGSGITIDELAFLCNVSPSTFKRKFAKIYGTSPQKWMVKQKMKLAANLLKHPEERPAQVYEKVGYENHSSFTHAFKQQYGITPKEYQNKNLNF